MNIKWDSEKYTSDFSFVHKYGEDLFNLITKPEKDKKPSAADIGCGNGALTKKLADMGFSVIGIDDSAEMIKTAEVLHPDITFEKGNASYFVLENKADLIFSNAVLHWIDKALQEKTAENIFRNLKSGGIFVCEFGGKGCAEKIHSALERIFEQRGLVYPRTFYFPTVGEYASVLERAGFRVINAFLFDRPTPQGGEDGLKNWIKMFIKKPFENMSDTQSDEIISQTEKVLRPVLYKDGVWTIDYVRIRIKAEKP